MNINSPQTPHLTNAELEVHTNSIPGMLVVDLVVHGDERGWFKENFQREKLVELGFPKNFEIVQNNITHNREMGVTRGIHAEPWNKYISLASGKIFVAIVDFREGEGFGITETLELTPEKAIYLPAGCGNSYQTLTENVEYTYLVDAHWAPDTQYTTANLGDKTLAIEWPIPLEKAIISDKDKGHSMLADVEPIKL